MSFKNIDFKEEICSVDLIKTVEMPDGRKKTFRTMKEMVACGAMQFSKFVLDGKFFGYITKEKYVSKIKDAMLAYPIGRVEINQDEYMYIFYTTGFAYPEIKDKIIVNASIDIDDIEAFEKSTPVFAINTHRGLMYTARANTQTLSSGELRFIQKNAQRIDLAQTIHGITSLYIFPTGETFAISKDKLVVAVTAEHKVLISLNARALLNDIISTSGKAAKYNIDIEALLLPEIGNEPIVKFYEEHFSQEFNLTPQEIKLLVSADNIVKIDSITYRLISKGISLIITAGATTKELLLDTFLTSKAIQKLEGIPGIGVFYPTSQREKSKTVISAAWNIFSRYLLRKFNLDLSVLYIEAEQKVKESIKRLVSSAVKLKTFRELRSFVDEQIKTGLTTSIPKVIDDGKAYIPKIAFVRYIKFFEDTLPGDLQTYMRILEFSTKTYIYGTLDCYVFELTEEELVQEEKQETTAILKDFLKNSLSETLTEVPPDLLDDVKSLGVVFSTGDGRARLRIKTIELAHDIWGKIEARSPVGLQCEDEETARKLASIFIPYECVVIGDTILLNNTDFGYDKYLLTIEDGYICLSDELTEE